MHGWTVGHAMGWFWQLVPHSWFGTGVFVAALPPVTWKHVATCVRLCWVQPHVAVQAPVWENSHEYVEH